MTTGRGAGSAGAAGAGSGSAIGAGAEATGAGAAAGAEAVWPQITCRLRSTRGTQVTLPSIPARMYTQPRLSTYCRPVKEAGGNSAGAASSSRIWATPEVALAESPIATANAAQMLDLFITSPHRFGAQHDKRLLFSKAVSGLFCAEHPVTRIT